MDYKKLIEETKSTRDYKEKKVPNDVIDKIIDYAKITTSIFSEQKIEMQYLKSGDEVYHSLRGVAGFHGIMLEAPQYLLFLSENKENHQLNVGYYVQQILLKLQELGVHTCWINIPQDGEIVKEALNVAEKKEAAALVAIGYSNNESKVVNRFHFGENYSKTDIKVVENNVAQRLSMDQVIYLDHWENKISVQELNGLGLDDIFHYVVLAPSTMNRQPWRFLLKDDRVFLSIRQDDGVNEELDLLDAGIVMLYLEKAMNEFNILGKWHVQVGTQLDGVPQNYKYIGYFSKNE